MSYNALICARSLPMGKGQTGGGGEFSQLHEHMLYIPPPPTHQPPTP